MLILPAIDLYEGKAVRLYKGNYDKMTVYDDEPLNTARKFEEAGAEWIHIVDLEAARDGGRPNKDTVRKIVKNTGLKVEIGGGIRSMEIIDECIADGANRVILGTAAVNDEELVRAAVKKYGEKVAVSADIREGYVAIKGWTESSRLDLDDFCSTMENIGVQTMICTDVSKDGAMKGTNREMYQYISKKCSFNLIASGGVTTMDDIKALKTLKIYGAIVGRAYYEGAIDLKEAIEVAE